MDQADILPLIEDLWGDIDALSTALAPLLSTSFSTISSKLPLLDKAKLHILTTYAIESVLFSSLRLSSVDAKQHPVFTELARVRQYFEKVKRAEEGPEKREQVLHKGAAGRFIKHALSGNEQYDKARAQNQARQRDATTQELRDLGTPTIRLQVGSVPRATTERDVRTAFARDKRGFQVESVEFPAWPAQGTPQGYVFVNVFASGTKIKNKSHIIILGQSLPLRIAKSQEHFDPEAFAERKRELADEFGEASSQPRTEYEPSGKRRRTSGDDDGDDAASEPLAPEPKMSKKQKKNLLNREEKKEKKAMDNFLGLGNNGGNAPA